jgi:hypothetical protein
MATAFHLFNLLPLELRQHIWELSMTPRRVPVGDFSKHSYPRAPLPPLAPPPAVLHACVESRSRLVRYYSKILTRESLSRYIWVNYELDIICINEWSVEDLDAELPPIKHLSVVVTSDENFWREIIPRIQRMPSLENLEIKPTEKVTYWWRGWDDAMDHLHYRYSDIKTPVHFYVTVLSPMPDHEVPALTTDNYFKVERELRKRDMAKNPEKYIGVEMSDSDDDFCRPG